MAKIVVTGKLFLSIGAAGRAEGDRLMLLATGRAYAAREAAGGNRRC